MKRLPLSLSALAVLILCAGSYWHRAREEKELQRAWDAAGAENKSGSGAEATAPGGQPHKDSKEELIAQALTPPIPKKLTPEEAEELFRRWSVNIKAEEKRLLDAKQEPFGKMKPYEDYLSKIPAEDLLAICLAIPSEETLMYGGMNWESSDREIRQLMWNCSFQSMVNRFPFLSLQLPWNQPDSRPWSATNSTLKLCAARDAEATWEVVRQRFGGKKPILPCCGVCWREPPRRTSVPVSIWPGNGESSTK